MTKAEALQDRLMAGEIVVIDGGMGSEIEARGVEMNDVAWCALANIQRLDVVQQVHEDYIKAGADVIITNTFAAGRSVLEDAGHGSRFEEVNRRAVEAARRARDAAGPATVIAGSIGGLPTASDAQFGDRGLSSDELFGLFSEQAAVLADAGVDLLALEMIGPGGHGEAALRGALTTGLPVWMGISVLRQEETGRTDYGTLSDMSDRAEFDRLVRTLAVPDIAAVTVMHSHIDEVHRAFDVVRTHWAGPLGTYPHVGTFNAPNWQFEDITPEQYLGHARTWVEHGAQIVGGCCGIRPAHIAALRRDLPTHIANHAGV